MSDQFFLRSIVWNIINNNNYEFAIIDDILTIYSIQCSLSNKGATYDNAIPEVIFKFFETECVRNQRFENLISL